MKNAHLRFGWLSYYKRTEKTTTNFKVRLDRFIGEVEPDSPRRAKAHLISVVGGDTQIAAINAAISTGESFEVEGPDVDRISVSLGRNAQTYRASLQQSEPSFLWMSLTQIHGLPGTPEWAEWFCQRLEKQKSIIPMLGIGCKPVLVKGDKKSFLRWLGLGVQRGLLGFPAIAGRIEWPRTSLAEIFTPESIARELTH
jgi:hypothetical protein